jgi:tripartite ATP-independent transporter DctP family solute receptor
MKKMAVLAVGFFLLFFAFPSFGDAAEILKFSPENPLKMRVGLDDRADLRYPDYAFGRVFKSVVETRTNGAVQVDLFPNGELGPMKERLQMVQSGALEATVTTGVMAGFYPEIQVLYLPYLFKSDEIAWDFLDNSKVFADLKERMRKKTGFRVLGVGSNGFRSFHNSKRELRKPEDFKGLKFRVMQSPIFVKMVEAMGAKAVPISWSELYTSLQTGVIEGAEVPAAYIEMGKLYEVQKYLTLNEHSYSEDIFVISDSFFQRLPADVQQIFVAAGRQAEICDRSADTILMKVTALEVIKKTMKIYSPTNEEKENFKKVSQGPVVQWLKGEVGAEVVDSVLKDIQRIEKRFGY